MSDGNPELIRKMADLARLALSDDEIELFSKQLKPILGYVAQLSEVPVVRADGSEVEPMRSPLEGALPLRPDEPVEPLRAADGSTPKMLTSASDVLYDSFKVPPVL